MTDATFWRLIWKEYRLQRGFFAAILCLALLVQILGMLTATIHGERITADGLFLIAAGAVVLYALGCGATLFATEHESGTFDFQRNLPLSAARCFGGKLAFGLGSTAAMMLLVWIVTLGVARGELPNGDHHAVLWSSGMVAALEMLAWGAFFSLILRHPLTAAVLGVATTSVIVHLVVPQFTGFRLGHLGADHYAELLPQRLAFSLLLLGVDACLGLRWFHDSEIIRPRGGSDAGDRDGDASPDGRAGWVGRDLRALGSLIWQNGRQSSRPLCLFTGIGLALILFCVISWGQTSVENRLIPIGWLVPLAAIFGCCTFLHDQSRFRFRFLAERGANARLVWFSRHVIWGGTLAVLVAAAGLWAVSVLHISDRQEVRDPFGNVAPASGEAFKVVVALFGMILVSYAAGQACSLFIRSPILSVTLGLASALALSGWVTVTASANIPGYWSVAPIPLVLLWATWLRAPDWLVERRTWWAQCRAVLSLAIPLAALFVAASAYRVFEIPQEAPGFSPREFDRPLTAEERESSELYVAAAKKLVPDGSASSMAASNVSQSTTPGSTPSDPSHPDRPLLKEEVTWVLANAQVINDLLAASRRNSAPFYDPHTNHHFVTTGTGKRFSSLLLASAKHRQSAGELDAAWERYLALLRMTRHARSRGGWYEHRISDDLEQDTLEQIMHWASLPQQSSERLQRAVGQLRDYSTSVPLRESCIKNEYILTRRFLELDLSAADRLAMTAAHAQRFVLLFKLMPWEQARARRLLDAITATSLRRLRTAEVSLDRGDDPQGIAVEDWDPRASKWRESTIALEWTLWRRFGLDAVEQEFLQAAMRRAVLIQLALRAWYLDHGALPQKLEELTEGYLAPLPPDPYTGRAYHYVLQGRRENTRWGVGSEWKLPGGQDRVRVVPQNTPFLWSAGPRIGIYYYYLNADIGRQYLLQDNHGNYFRAASEMEALTRGWAFPLTGLQPE